MGPGFAMVIYEEVGYESKVVFGLCCAVPLLLCLVGLAV